MVDLSRQRELDANPKVIQQVEFVGELKEKLMVMLQMQKRTNPCLF